MITSYCFGKTKKGHQKNQSKNYAILLKPPCRDIKTANLIATYKKLTIVTATNTD